MNSFRQALDELFNWKKNPKSVFFFALPLFVLGFALHVAYAYLQWTINGDIGYFYILLAGTALLCFGLWPIRKKLHLIF